MMHYSLTKIVLLSFGLSSALLADSGPKKFSHPRPDTKKTALTKSPSQQKTNNTNTTHTNANRTQVNRTPAHSASSGTFSSVSISRNETVSGDLSVGGKIKANNDVFVKRALKIGDDNCHQGSLVVNGSQRVTDNLTVDRCINAQSIKTDTLISNSLDCRSAIHSSTKTGSLTVANDAQIGGTLYVDEIDPFNGRTTCFSGNIAIAENKKLLTNEINPVKTISCCNGISQCVEDDTGTTCFSADAAINPSHKLLVNEINPVKLDEDGQCVVDDTGTTCFSGNVAVSSGNKLFVNEINPVQGCEEYDGGTTTMSGNVGILQNLVIDGTLYTNEINPTLNGEAYDAGTTCFSGNVAVSEGHTLFVNKIDPVQGCEDYDCGTTEFSGNVRCDKDMDFPATALDTNCDPIIMGMMGPMRVLGSPLTVGAITVNGERFIHNFGQAGDASDGNTFVGLDSGNFSMTGIQNTAIGSSTLASNTTGGSNSALGFQALEFNVTGTGNTALGWWALRKNTATHNTAVGSQALAANSTGVNNVAVGATSLSTNTTGFNNTALGTNSLNVNTSGSHNTSVGNNSLQHNTTGYYNTAVGDDSLFSNTTGYYNTAVGFASLFSNTTGANNNSALGAFSLFSNTTGNSNIAIGSGSLFSNATGTNNTAVGFSTLNLNTVNQNTAIGSSALTKNTIGTPNTAVGYQALFANTTGNNNVAVGYQALFKNTTGNNNTALGSNTLSNVTTGTSNTALGFNAAINYTDGESDNIIIGNNGVVGDGKTGPGVIRIGATGVQGKCFIAGIRGVTTNIADTMSVLIDSAGQLGTINSSRRYKKDINDMNEASAQLMQLHPISFRYKSQPDDAPLEYGLIAEEVAKVFPELAVYNKDGEPESVRYHVLPSLLLNEIQHQQKTLDGHDEKFSNFDQQLNTLAEQIVNLDLHDKQLDEAINQMITREQLNDVLKRLEQIEKTLKTR